MKIAKQRISEKNNNTRGYANFTKNNINHKSQTKIVNNTTISKTQHKSNTCVIQIGAIIETQSSKTHRTSQRK